jgi:pimeloyl-ACP methyl ester carboxylesterase
MADRDPALRPEYEGDMPEPCSNLAIHLVENSGHWVLQEQPTVFNKHLISWLKQRFGQG